MKNIKHQGPVRAIVEFRKMFPIQKGVPLPKKQSNSVYPFQDMKPGDSFSFEVDSISRIEAAAHQYARKCGGGLKFSIRKIDDNLGRIWRVK